MRNVEARRYEQSSDSRINAKEENERRQAAKDAAYFRGRARDESRDKSSCSPAEEHTFRPPSQIHRPKSGHSKGKQNGILKSRSRRSGGIDQMYLQQAEDLFSDDTGHDKQSRDQTRPKETARLLESRLQAES